MSVKAIPGRRRRSPEAGFRPWCWLAAHRSEWARQNKLLAEVNGTTLVYQAVETAILSDTTEVIIVTGHEADFVRQALSGFDVRFVHNPHYPEGLSTSLRAGIGAVSENLPGP